MTDMNLLKWKINSSKYLVNDSWLKLRVDSCTTPGGHVIEPYYVFEYPDWVNCFVIDDNNDVIMLQHYRHGIGEYLPELVSGGLEAHDTSPEEGIRRELEEELGYVGEELYQLGVSYPNPANHTNKVYSFIAIGGSCKQAQKIEKGESLHITKTSLKDLADSLESNNPTVIYQSLHMVTMFLALNFIKNSGLPSVQELKETL